LLSDALVLREIDKRLQWRGQKSNRCTTSRGNCGSGAMMIDLLHTNN
jgi:hypothetical protein